MYPEQGLHGHESAPRCQGETSANSADTQRLMRTNPATSRVTFRDCSSGCPSDLVSLGGPAETQYDPCPKSRGCCGHRDARLRVSVCIVFRRGYTTGLSNGAKATKLDVSRILTRHWRRHHCRTNFSSYLGQTMVVVARPCSGERSYENWLLCCGSTFCRRRVCRING
jgi:hypothetical protein